MVAPGFLTNPDVLRWLNGVEPAWTVLEYDSYNGLRDEPSASNRTIRLEPNLTSTDLSGSAIARDAVLLLRRAADTDGLKLTATGNLSRAVVAEMCRTIEWPDYDKEELFGFNKVINEPDFLPLHFVRVLVQETKLLRMQLGKLVATRLGKSLLVPEQYGALQAVLFHIAFWHINLAYFDRRPLELLAPERCGYCSLGAVCVGERLVGPRNPHASLHGSGHRGSGGGVGSWVQPHGGPHSATADVVRAARTSQRTRSRAGRAASLPEDAAVRSLREIRGSDREAGYTPLTAAPSVILDRGDATTLPAPIPTVKRMTFS